MNDFTLVVNTRAATRVEVKRTLKSLSGTEQSPLSLIIVGLDPKYASAVRIDRLRSRHVRIASVAETHGHVIFMRAGDSLLPMTLEILSRYIADHPDHDLLYGDSTHGSVSRWDEPTEVRRPGWSPERLRSHCYVGELLIAPIVLVEQAGGLEKLAATDSHDRALRLSELAMSPARIAELLYASDHDHLQPTCSIESVRQHCVRTGIDADCESDEHLPIVRVRRRVPTEPRISVIIPTRGTVEVVHGTPKVLVAHTIETLIARSTYTNFEIVVVADTQTSIEARGAIIAAGGSRVRIIEFSRPFNFAEKINLGVVASESELVLLLNDDTEIISPDALHTMVGILSDPGVAMVGPMLLYEDGTIQSAGHILNPVPYDLYRSRSLAFTGAQYLLRVQREVSGVIAACALIKRSVFNEVGGLCAQFPSNYNDVDFGLKVQELGYRVLFTPYAQFFHFESQTRSPLLQTFEVATIGARWRDKLDNDPYFNPHLERYVSMWKQNQIGQRSLLDALGPTAPIASK
ncbi:MAG: glycosyltransferase [Actinomycetota bacterium]